MYTTHKEFWQANLVIKNIVVLSDKMLVLASNIVKNCDNKIINWDMMLTGSW